MNQNTSVDGQPEVRDALRRAAMSEGQPLTQDKYEQWNKKHSGDYPTVEVMKTRLDADGWLEVVAVVELQACRYSVKEAKTALRKAAEDVGEPLTQFKYRRWRKSQGKTTPASKR